jgi:hypothetical protein
MKETWRIINNSNQNVKIACKTESFASKGIILQPNEFCISESQLTSSLDAQERRGFIKVDRNFDNSKLNLEFVKVYREDELVAMLKEIENKSDFEKAAENAEKYINK